MLFKFDPSKIEIELVKIKSVSSALGGSIQLLDEEMTAETGSEVCFRVPVPMAVARMFRVKYEVTHFMEPHEGALVKYEGRIVGIEKAIINERVVDGAFGTRNWIPESKIRFDSLNNKIFSQNEWFFDGTFAYRFGGPDLANIIANAEPLDKEHLFKSVHVDAIQLTQLSYMMPEIEQRSCLAFMTEDHEFAITPPIWKELGNVGVSHSTRGDDGDNINLSAQFEELDKKMAINLNFALYAGKEMVDAFGYDSIEPLQIPRLMVQLKTVNLPKVLKAQKATHNIGLKFTHAAGWLLGVLKDTNQFEQMVVIRKLLKYLTTKGLYRKDVMTAKKTLVDHTTTELVPLITLDAARSKQTDEAMREAFEQSWYKKKMKRHTDLDD